jgi:hypothetical protein
MTRKRKSIWIAAGGAAFGFCLLVIVMDMIW